jgi:hypothetical protein
MQGWLESRESDALGFKVLRSHLPPIAEFSDTGVVSLLNPEEAPAHIQERERVEQAFADEVAALIRKWLETR